MKLGRKKPPSAPSSSSRASFISHVFPTSWLSKFKHMSIHTKPDPRKVKRKGKQNSSPVGSRQSCASGNGGRFYGGDDDGAFWRLSFGEESANGEKINGGVLRSVWYESDDELDVLSSRGCGSRCPKLEEEEEARKVNKLPKGVEISMDMHTSNKEKKTESRAPRRRTQKDWKLRRMDRQVMEEQLLELGRRSYEAERESTESGENEASKIEPPRPISTTKRDNCKFAPSSSRKHSSEPCLNSKNSSFRTITDDGGFTTKNLEETEGFSTENLDSECQNLKEMKTEKLRSKTVQERKSLHVSRESQRKRAKKYSKVRAYSPRTPSKVEIKALEDIRKSKMKMKKKVKEGTAEEGAGLDRFAVVKCSSNPQQDFRDSMLEMIMEKRMRRPEELEELLACYLTLNSDEYHDLIIKVFRQVWFDLDHSCFYTELRNEDCCCG